MATGLVRTIGTELAESELVRLAQARQPAAIRAIVKRYNQRLYRLARAILRSDADAEEALQEAYLRAFAAIDSFRGEASLSTWLSRITINEALARLRRRRRQERLKAAVAEERHSSVIPFPLAVDDPERSMGQRQILELVERASDNLPETYRLVFVARVIEGLSVEETAEALEVRPATVKTRLYRARALLRRELEAQIGPLLLDGFPFAGKRCDRMTENVLARLGFAEPR